MQRILVCVLVTLSLVASRAHADDMSAPPLPAGDPMDWSPPATPAQPHEGYPHDEYARRFKDALQKIDRKSMVDSKRPKNGLEITRIDSGGQADHLGIHVGDIAITLDGIDTTSADQFRSIRKDGPQELTIWSADGGVKKLTLQPDKLGVNFEPYTDRAKIYLESKDRDPRWDDAILVAVLNEDSDPPLSETALLEAQRAGYRGKLLPLLGARLAYRQMRFDDAMAIGWAELWNSKPSDSFDIDLYALFRPVYGAALLNFKLEAALQLAERFTRYGGDDVPSLRSLVKRYRSMPKSNTTNPIERLETIPCTDLISSFATADGAPKHVQEQTDWALGQLKEGRLSTSVETDHFMYMEMKPALANLDAQVRYQFKPYDNGPHDFGRDLCFGIFDASAPGGNHGLALRVVMFDNGSIQLECPGRPEVTLSPWPPFNAGTPEHPGAMRMTVVGNRAEIVIDGRRVFYGPALANEAHRKFGLTMQLVGIKVDLTDLAWKRADVELEQQE